MGLPGLWLPRTCEHLNSVGSLNSRGEGRGLSLEEATTLKLFCDMGLHLYCRHHARARIFASLNGEDTLDNVLGNCTSLIDVTSVPALVCLGTV